MDIFVARQPIFDSKLNVYGYELLYRSNMAQQSFAQATEANLATSNVIVNSFLNIGTEKLTGGKRVFINFTRDLLTQEVATLFPSDALVIEVLEDIEPDEDVVRELKLLKERGYLIALDDFIFDEKYTSFLELADIVKIDVLLTPIDEIRGFLNAYRGSGIRFLAEKVEDKETFTQAQEAGFSYFQGYFFSKPVIVSGQDIRPLPVNYIHLIREANKKSINFQSIASIITRDVSLSYKLLKLINSVGYGVRYQVKSILHALVFLGANETRKWISLLSMMGINGGQADELLHLSLGRGRFFELIAPCARMNGDGSTLFMLGLFSLMDTIMGRPFGDIFEGINVSSEIIEALVEGKGRFAPILELGLAYEQADWDRVTALCDAQRMDAAVVSQCYVDALWWSESILSGGEG